MKDETQATKAFDAEGNPILVTQEETEAGIATHVEPDPDAGKDEDDEENEDAENGKKGTANTLGADDDDARAF